MVTFSISRKKTKSCDASKTSKQVQGLELQPRVKPCLGVKQGLANFEPKTCLGALLSTKQDPEALLSTKQALLSKL